MRNMFHLAFGTSYQSLPFISADDILGLICVVSSDQIFQYWFLPQLSFTQEAHTKIQINCSAACGNSNIINFTRNNPDAVIKVFCNKPGFIGFTSVAIPIDNNFNGAFTITAWIVKWRKIAGIRYRKHLLESINYGRWKLMAVSIHKR